MPPTMPELGIDRLSIEDRLALAQEIWDSVAQEVEREPLSVAQRQELERAAGRQHRPPRRRDITGRRQGAGVGQGEAMSLPAATSD